MLNLFALPTIGSMKTPFERDKKKIAVRAR